MSSIPATLLTATALERHRRRVERVSGQAGPAARHRKHRLAPGRILLKQFQSEETTSEPLWRLHETCPHSLTGDEHLEGRQRAAPGQRCGQDENHQVL